MDPDRKTFLASLAGLLLALTGFRNWAGRSSSTPSIRLAADRRAVARRSPLSGDRI